MLLAVLMTLSLLPVSGKTVKAYADSAEVPSEEKTGLTGNDLKMSLLYSGYMDWEQFTGRCPVPCQG